MREKAKTMERKKKQKRKECSYYMKKKKSEMIAQLKMNMEEPIYQFF